MRNWMRRSGARSSYNRSIRRCMAIAQTCNSRRCGLATRPALPMGRTVLEGSLLRSEMPDDLLLPWIELVKIVIERRQDEVLEPGFRQLGNAAADMARAAEKIALPQM